MLNLTLIVLFIALTISFFRYLKARTIWERLLNLNLISIKVLLLITVDSLMKEDLNLLDTSVTFAIVSFLVVVLLSKFILKGGRTK